MVLKIVRCKNEKKNKCPKQYVEKEGAKRLVPCQCGGERAYSNNWYVRLHIDGKSYFRAVSSKKDEAIAHEAMLLEDRRNGAGHFAHTQRMTIQEGFDKVFEPYMEKRIETGKVSPASADIYRRILKKRILPFLGNKLLAQFNLSLVEEYVTHIRNAQYSGKNWLTTKQIKLSTINRHMTAMSALVKVLLRNKLLRENPLFGYEPFKEEATRDRVLSDEEVDRLLEECKSQYNSKGKIITGLAPEYLYTMVLIGLNTGLRKDGVLGLRWEHINFVTNEITRTVKRGRVVYIPMSEALKAGLIAWRDRKGATVLHPKGLLFPSPVTGKEMCVGSNIGFTEATKRAGVAPFVFHQLRHTFVTHLIASGKTLEQAGAIVGHSSTYMTSRYCHLLRETHHKTMEGFQIGGKKHA